MVIGILDEFFIQFSDLLIKFLVRIIDFTISFFNKLSNGGSIDEREYSKNENNFENKADFNNGEIFKIGNFLKNDSIFEELENRYSNDSYSNLSSSSKRSQNIFTSLKKRDDENSDLNPNKINENK
ncbi:MAG: hypothetical protein IKS93_04970, partial [Methanobrevibacter sp.]|nr:hypothetical protein [Methanobrevibacter sp.]